MTFFNYEVEFPMIDLISFIVFSDDDFKGFRDVGKGSKRDNKQAIGQYGRGSQTMYHWTDVPMLLTGKWFLILE